MILLSSCFNSTKNDNDSATTGVSEVLVLSPCFIQELEMEQMASLAKPDTHFNYGRFVSYHRDTMEP